MAVPQTYTLLGEAEEGGAPSAGVWVRWDMQGQHKGRDERITPLDRGFSDGGSQSWVIVAPPK